MSNATEIGNTLQSMATSVTAGIHGYKGAAAGALADAMSALAQCKLAAEEPTNQVAHLLGEGHSGVDAIVGNTALVTETLESAGAMVQEAIGRLEAVTDAVSNLGFVYQNVGAHIAAGGGS